MLYNGYSNKWDDCSEDEEELEEFEEDFNTIEEDVIEDDL